MHITGIIAEYNPLHLGHQFHITKTRELIQKNVSEAADASHYIITVLSGDFVQRGLPAILDKHTRTRMALEAGSDLVLELPAPYALSSGEGFAFGGVSLLHQLGCVDTLSFGSEAGELDSLMQIAQILQTEGTESQTMEFQSTGKPMKSPERTPYHTAYQTALKQGLTHPAARLQALREAYPELDTSLLDGHSNNMLALEYCKAIYRLGSRLQPVTIKRQGQAYLEHELMSGTDISDSASMLANAGAVFASATAIREALKETDFADTTELSRDVLFDFVSSCVKDILLNAHAKNRLIYPNDFSLILHYKLLSLSKAELTNYREISPDFANKIIKNLSQFENFTQFANLLWTKDMTYARVCRNLMNIILDIKKNTWDVHQPVPYARVLGFRKESAPLLSEIKKKASIPIISKLADAEKLLTPDAYRLLELDMKAAHVYDSVVLQKSGQKTPHEMQKQIARI